MLKLFGRDDCQYFEFLQPSAEFWRKIDLCEESRPKFQSQETVGSSTIHRFIEVMSSTPLGACMATPIAASLVAWLQIRMLGSREVGNSCVSYSHDGSMVLLYIWCSMDPINIPPFMLALIYQHHGSVMGLFLAFVTVSHDGSRQILSTPRWEYGMDRYLGPRPGPKKMLQPRLETVGVSCIFILSRLW